MKKDMLKSIFIGTLILGSLSYATGKTDAAIKDTSKAASVTLKSDRTKLSAERVKQIAIARVPGSTLSNIKDFRSEGSFFAGTLVFNGMKYQFEIDAYTGRAIKWETDK